ncbi:MAG: alpha-L-fucosidase [Bryobacteraceae bacterium]
MGTLCSLLLFAMPALAAPPDRAAWFRKAEWGVFIHYLAKGPEVPVDEWNRLVDGFNAEGLARQLESAGTGYLILTLGQNSGHYLSPNRTYDSLVGIRPSKCSRRDLVADLAAALERRGIRMMVYLPAGAPDKDTVAMAKLEWRIGPHRNLEFQQKWQRVIEEWSVHWGKRVSGWWFDGCYWPNAMYRSTRPPNFGSFAAAARKGNPESIVAFNRGVVYPIISISEHEDYTAGEADDPAKAGCATFWRDGAQCHVLSYLGANWSRGEPRFDASQAAARTRKLIAEGGVVTWDVPTVPDGLISEAFLEQLRAIGKSSRAPK